VVLSGSYSVIFANISASADKCFPAGKVGNGINPATAAAAADMVAKSAELEPGRFAQVERMTSGLFGKNVFLSLDIRAIPSGAEVDYYISSGFFGRFDNNSSFEPIVKSWARGDATKCD
jgi:hypothetical protein